jgi:hypothetical protein
MAQKPMALAKAGAEVKRKPPSSPSVVPSVLDRLVYLGSFLHRRYLPNCSVRRTTVQSVLTLSTIIVGL